MSIHEKIAESNKDHERGVKSVIAEYWIFLCLVERKESQGRHQSARFVDHELRSCRFVPEICKVSCDHVKHDHSYHFCSSLDAGLFAPPLDMMILAAVLFTREETGRTAVSTVALLMT